VDARSVEYEEHVDDNIPEDKDFEERENMEIIDLEKRDFDDEEGIEEEDEDHN
jgi:hypothetical protein